MSPYQEFFTTPTEVLSNKSIFMKLLIFLNFYKKLFDLRHKSGGGGGSASPNPSTAKIPVIPFTPNIKIIK